MSIRDDNSSELTFASIDIIYTLFNIPKFDLLLDDKYFLLVDNYNLKVEFCDYLFAEKRYFTY